MSIFLHQTRSARIKKIAAVHGAKAKTQILPHAASKVQNLPLPEVQNLPHTQILPLVKTGEELREWSDAHGYTVKTLAAELELSVRTVVGYRLDGAKIPKVVALALLSVPNQ